MMKVSLISPLNKVFYKVLHRKCRNQNLKLKKKKLKYNMHLTREVSLTYWYILEILPTEGISCKNIMHQKSAVSI